MTAFETLFSFEGRIARTRYWAALLAFTIFLLAIAVVFRVLLPAIGVDIHPAVKTLFGLAISIPYVVAFLAILVKRLHDLGLSGWWILIVTIPAAVATTIGWDLVKQDFTDAFGYTWRSAIDNRFSDAVAIVCVIVLGLIPGTRGPNRYGSAPKSSPINPADRPG